MIKYLNYNEKKLPVRISYKALQDFKAETGIEFDELAEKGDLSLYEPLLYYALKSGHKGLKKEFTLQREDKEELEEILEECFMDFVALMAVFFPGGEDEVDGKKQQPNRKQRRILEKKSGK